MSKTVLWLVVAVVVAICWPANPFDLSSVKVEIPQGATARTAQRVLQENYILPHYTAFRYLIRLLGQQNRIKAGEYNFSPSDNLPRVIARLTMGETVPQQEESVTFPEGMSIYKMGLILKDKGFTDWQSFPGPGQRGHDRAAPGEVLGYFQIYPVRIPGGILVPGHLQNFLEGLGRSDGGNDGQKV